MALRVLIVEDEMTIALLIEDMLVDLGHEVAGMSMRLPQAMELAKSAAFDLAILDVNLDGLTSFDVAHTLAERKIPFLFVTGYGPAGIAPQYQDRITVKKPFAQSDLQVAIDQALKTSGV